MTNITTAFKGLAWSASSGDDWPVVVWVRGEWNGNDEEGEEARMACTIISDAEQETCCTRRVADLHLLATPEDWKVFKQAKHQALIAFHEQAAASYHLKSTS